MMLLLILLKRPLKRTERLSLVKLPYRINGLRNEHSSSWPLGTNVSRALKCWNAIFFLGKEISVQEGWNKKIIKGDFLYP